MTLVADANGEVHGKFTIPPNVRAGTKRARFVGASGTVGEANFVGQGLLTTRTLQEQTTTRTHTFRVTLDPLAQTFSLLAQEQIGGVDIFVTEVGTTPIMIQLRETQVGMPTQVLLAETQLRPDQITAGQWNRFTFDLPTTLLPDVEYAIVVLCNDPVSSVAIAELGKYDVNANQWVTSQPYQVGVLLSSANASTWTPHQDRDLAFRLLAARYTESVREIDLGSVALDAATDLLVLTTTDQQSFDTGVEVDLTLPGGEVVTTGDGQVVQLPTATTGNCGVKARISANNKISAVLFPGAQVVAGTAQMSCDYVSRAFDADAEGADIRIIFDANLPSGSTVDVFVSGTDLGDNWLPVSQDGVAKPIGSDFYEYQFLYDNLEEAAVRVKLVLTGTISARPVVKNLRVSVV